MSNFKVPALRSDDYMAWVRTLPCANCGSGYKSEAHHRIGHGRLSSKKTDDYEAMPLCRQCHGSLHDAGWLAWEAVHRTQHQMVVETLLQAIRQEVLVLDQKVAKGIARYG